MPVETSLGVELTRWSRDAGIGSAKKKEMAAYASKIKKYYIPDRSQLVQDELQGWLDKRLRARAIRTLVDLEDADELTNDMFMRVLQDTIKDVSRDKVTDWLEGVLARHTRRLISAS